MNDDIALLGAIVKNTEMGRDALEQILDVTDNEAFKASLQIQRNGFAQLGQEARQALAQRGEAVPKQGAMSKLSAAVAIAGRTLADNSTRHLADMLIQGSSVGTVECVKAQRDNPKASAEVQGLAQRLQQFEERNEQELKSFL